MWRRTRGDARVSVGLLERKGKKEGGEEEGKREKGRKAGHAQLRMSKLRFVRYFRASTAGTMRLSYALMDSISASNTTGALLWLSFPRDLPICLTFSFVRRLFQTKEGECV
jgi:hypothetical protein